MTTKHFLIITSTIIFSLLIASGCKKENEETWLIVKDEVKDGGPGKDGIPALESQTFVASSEVSYLDDNDLILGIVSGNVARAYPHPVLDWHEIINDKIDNIEIAVVYCPLTGTGTGWNRIINGELTTFGVSGLLYNSNIIPYDRKTDSNWSQLRLDCVNGELIGTKIETIPLVETTWKTWKAMYPNTTVVSENTGHNRNYNVYPYGDYKTNQSKLLFPVNKEDGRLPNKERVHTVIEDNSAKAYKLSDFDSGVKAITDNFAGKSLIIVGSSEQNFAVSFERQLSDGTSLDFTAVQDALPIILTDTENNEWDIFGTAVSGPRAGQQLVPTNAIIGYWFSFAAFYDNLLLYE